MNKLPIEIIREHIAPYTYRPQSKELCQDIKSFINVRDYLHKLYYERWKFSLEYEENADKNWLDNDIGRFMNEDRATMLGYVDSNINKYSRIFKLFNKNSKEIRAFIEKTVHSNSVAYSINVQLGILNCHERIELIDFAHSLDLIID